MTAVPAIFASIAQLSSQDDIERLQQLDSFGVGGASLPEDLFQWAASLRIQCFDGSGATEMAGTICIRRALDPHQKITKLQVIDGLMGVLEKDNEKDNFGELIILGKVRKC